MNQTQTEKHNKKQRKNQNIISPALLANLIKNTDISFWSNVRLSLVAMLASAETKDEQAQILEGLDALKDGLEIKFIPTEDGNEDFLGIWRNLLNDADKLKNLDNLRNPRENQ